MDDARRGDRPWYVMEVQLSIIGRIFVALNILLSHAPKRVSSNLEEALNGTCNAHPVWAHNVISMAQNRQKIRLQRLSSLTL
jgi:hypothetical protein